MIKNKVADWGSFPVSITRGELDRLEENQITTERVIAFLKAEYPELGEEDD
jgi:hypothetical protein